MLEAPTTGGDFELASLGIILGQFLDGDAGLDVPNVGLAQHELVEGNVPGRRQGDFLGRFHHQILSTTGAGSHSPDLTSRHPFHSPSLPLDMSTAVDITQLLPQNEKAFPTTVMG